MSVSLYSTLYLSIHGLCFENEAKDDTTRSTNNTLITIEALGKNRGLEKLGLLERPSTTPGTVYDWRDETMANMYKKYPLL